MGACQAKLEMMKMAKQPQQPVRQSVKLVEAAMELDPEPVKADEYKVSGQAVVLCYEEQNRGTVFMRFVVDVTEVNWEEKPLAYFVARKEIPAFKFRGIGAKVELMRDAAGKNLFTAYLEYLRKAQEYEGDVVLLRTGSLEDPHGFVQIVTCDQKDNLQVFKETAPRPALDEAKGYWRQLGPEKAKVKLADVTAVAVVGGDNTDFSGVASMVLTAFVIKGESVGRGANLVKTKDGKAPSADGKRDALDAEWPTNEYDRQASTRASSAA